MRVRAERAAYGSVSRLRRWIPLALVLLATACSDAAETAKEAVSLPFKVYRDSKSYVGEETIVLASAEANGGRITLSCLLVRPLTGSFWGGRADYSAHFNYEWSSATATAANSYAPPLRSATRDAAQARPLCKARATSVVARADGAGFDIALDGRVVATVANDGSMTAR